MNAIFWIVFAFLCILSFLFGGIWADIVTDCHLKKCVKEWKAWALMIIYALMFLITGWLSVKLDDNKTYDTKEYEIQSISTTIDLNDSTEVTTFKIVKKTEE